MPSTGPVPPGVDPADLLSRYMRHIVLLESIAYVTHELHPQYHSNEPDAPTFSAEERAYLRSLAVDHGDRSAAGFEAGFDETFEET